MSETKGNEGLFGKEFAEGRYRVGQKLGQGGYAEVYRAHEPEIDRDVALKILRTNKEGTYSDRLRKRFLREAKLVASLTEPHTIKLYDYGEEDGLLYLAFEYVEGETLGERLRREGPLKPLMVVKLLEQVLDSLKEAHDRGILHRDIKPGNIMLYEHERRGVEVKVLDFGIGKFVREQQKITQLTAEGRMIGTPRYMSPEQMRGSDNLGPACDLWAVGMVAYECLVGRPAVETDDAMAMMSRILDADKPFKLPSEIQVPEFLRQMVERLLQKDVNRRYEDAAEVLRDLEEFKTRATIELQESRLRRAGLVSGKASGASVAPSPKEPKQERRIDADATPAERPSARERANVSKQNSDEVQGPQKKPAAILMVLGGLIIAAVVAWAVMSGDQPNDEVPAFLKEKESVATAATKEPKGEASSLEKREAQESKEEASRSDGEIATKGDETAKQETAKPAEEQPVEKVEKDYKKPQTATAKRRAARKQETTSSQARKKADVEPKKEEREETEDEPEEFAGAMEGKEEMQADPAEAGGAKPEASEPEDEAGDTKLRIWGVE